MNPTIQTYAAIAADYAERTWNIRFVRALDSFARYLIPSARALDLECGPGRDIELLRQRGARVSGSQ
ncbi:MAG: hypothetical protein AB1817_15005 [Chloroflexota bacterium]